VENKQFAHRFPRFFGYAEKQGLESRKRKLCSTKIFRFITKNPTQDSRSSATSRGHSKSPLKQ